MGVKGAQPPLRGFQGVRPPALLAASLSCYPESF